MTDPNSRDDFEASAPRALRLLAAIGDASGRGDIIRQGWGYMPATVDPVDIALAYRGNRASTRRIVHAMDSRQRVDFCAWLHERLSAHNCHVPPVVLAEALRATSPEERARLEALTGSRKALADIFTSAGLVLADDGEGQA